jgi:glycerol-3-phosphate dehydrogenase
MNRDEMLRQLQDESILWDLVIIGGGATGLGVAVDAASRGYRPLLLEQSDFGKGTSSRSTKLVHGGVRYLQQGNVSLVLEALKERGLLRQNAPHLVHDLPFIVPVYDWWEGPFYGIGMKLYDRLAGKLGFGDSVNLSRDETIKRLPTIETEGLRGGVVYHDGQFDDARLVINLAQTANEQGATLLNYVSVRELRKKSGILSAVVAVDEESGASYTVFGKAIINATGVYTDAIRTLDDPTCPPMIKPSQGVHILLDKSFLPSDTALMVPHTDDGRVLFAIPWHDNVIVGTTDTPVDQIPLEPRALEEEVEFLLAHTARYLTRDPTRSDVLSVFAGLRPLVSLSEGEENTAAISRDHTLNLSRSGLLTIAGGKWTTYRKMAEDTVDQAVHIAGLEPEPCVTQNLNIHGHHFHAEKYGDLDTYGSDAPLVEKVIHEQPSYGEWLPGSAEVRAGQVVWAARHEMARTVEDFLSRRTRMLILDARSSIEAAPVVARLMAQELGHNEEWVQDQVDAYGELAKGYLPQHATPPS